MTLYNVPLFYNTPENLLRQMSVAHYHEEFHPLSPFSSWAASLHLVLCYAPLLETEAYVAVMDTQKLDSQVLVWHAPHLMDGRCHEYLAYGIIEGYGYVAVPLLIMKQNGLLDVFPELAMPRKRRATERHAEHNFGLRLKMEMFERKHGLPKKELVVLVRHIANLFGDLWFPVATALLCIRPWPWFQRSLNKRRDKPQTKELERIFRLSNVTMKPSWLDSNLAWLQPGAVVTEPDDGEPMYYFPDVRQWIDLLHAISCHDMSRSKKHKGKKGNLAAAAEEPASAKRQAVESSKAGSCTPKE